MTDLYIFDRIIEQETGCTLIGTDEAGRGSLAGPVVAAAVRLDLSNPIDKINDSKKIPPPLRQLLYEQITVKSISWAIGVASIEEIEKINILKASLLAMKRAIEALSCPWTRVLVDGNKSIGGIAPALQQCIVRGDAKSASIAAASIVAKVTRDRLMEDYHKVYPQYDFKSHKGYGTEHHRAMISRHGLCPIHRRSFCTSLFLQTSLPL
jgi:ribonuclease HII